MGAPGSAVEEMGPDARYVDFDGKGVRGDLKWACHFEFPWDKEDQLV